jgi:hypothetical protein
MEKVAGTFMLLFPLSLLAIVLFTGILFGSLGMDIHWNGKREWLYLFGFLAAVLPGAWMTVGAKLRNAGKRSHLT